VWLLCPALLLLIIGIWFAVERFGPDVRQRRWAKPFTRFLLDAPLMERYGSVFWVYFNLLQAPWIYVTLKMLSCVPTSPLSDEWVLESDPSIKCSGSLYEFHRAVAIILCVVWIYPLPVYSYLFTRRWLASRSIESNIRVACRALFQPYQETFVSLDWFFHMRRVLFWTMICLVPTDYRTYMGSMILVGLNGSEISLSPFVQVLDNHAQAVVSTVLVFTCTILSSSSFTAERAQTWTGPVTAVYYVFLATLVAFLVISYVFYRRAVQKSASTESPVRHRLDRRADSRESIGDMSDVRTSPSALLK